MNLYSLYQCISHNTIKITATARPWSSNMSLTAQFIKNVKPDHRERRYPDGKVAGLFLRVTKSGSKAFQLRYRYAKKDRSMVIGDPELISSQDARDTARKHLVDLSDGIDPFT